MTTSIKHQHIMITANFAEPILIVHIDDAQVLPPSSDRASGMAIVAIGITIKWILAVIVVDTKSTFTV